MKIYELIVDPSNLKLGILKVKKINKEYIEKYHVSECAIVRGDNDEHIINEILKRNKKFILKSI